MHTSFLLPLAAGFVADAAILQSRGGCSFHLHTSGAVSGPVGERDNGQTIEAGGIDAATFKLDGNKIVDAQGRGCFFTPPTKVLQCDAGATPADGFKIDCDGTLSFKGDTTFYECDAGNGVHNIYKEPNGSNCGKITLTADGCKPDDCGSSGGDTCPNDLNCDYEFPHLIIPIDSSKPDNAPGTSYNGKVTSTVSSIFNFDIPPSDDGKTCNLVFLFPKKNQLETSSFTFSGSGQIDFAMLDKAATGDTSYNNAPGVKKDYGVTTVSPGNAYDIASFDCPAGQRIAFEMSGPSGCDTSLDYFQDYNPCPIGLYITVS